MQNMNSQERPMIEDAKAKLGGIKKDLRKLDKLLTDLAPVVQASSGNETANAAMILQGAVLEALGILTDAHGHASNALEKGFADGGEIIVYSGGR